MSVQMISPPVTIFHGDQEIYVYGWYVPAPDSRAAIEPIVSNPDGHGVGRWSTYYGEDPWYAP